MNILHETEKFKIENEFENTFLVDKRNGEILLEDDFYGNPTCALIDEENNWAVIGGEHLTIWNSKKWKRIEHVKLKWIHDLRMESPNTVKILVDPWSESSSIWEIDTKTFKFIKVKDLVVLG